MRGIKYVLTTLLLLVVWSCRTTEYVPVEVIKSDTTYINKVKRDSIYQLDSVYILDRGDTILITKTKYLYRDKLVYDTVYRSRVDSVQVPYPVEKQLTRWQQLQLDVGGWAMGGFIVMIIFLIIYIYTKSAGADKK